MTLYERILSPSGRVTYREHIPQAGPDLRADEFDTAELLTWAISIGMTQLMILRKQLPEHARNARKIKAVEDAIYDLAAGHGKPLSDEMVDYVIGCWNRTMGAIQQGLEPAPIKGGM